MLLRKLFRTALKYKAQFISMVLMVAIGAGVFLGFNIEWKSIEVDTGNFFALTRYADFRLYSQSALGFTAQDVQSVREIAGVDAATRYLTVNVGIENTKKALSLNVSEDYTVSTMLITAGAEYDPTSQGIWLSDRFAQANGIAIGDTLTLTYSGFDLSGEVVGLAKCGEQMICLADSNQLMPDYEAFGFAFISPAKLKTALRGFSFYPQINLRSALSKEELEPLVNAALGRTTMITDKMDHVSYAEAMGEAEEGKTMGSVLPVLFLAIAMLTMVTTMHRIAANEKVQIGTLKALGFRDRRILRHYTSYGLFIGLAGTALGIALGYGIAAFIMSPTGMMATYFDMVGWDLVMPAFCWPILGVMLAALTAISYLSVKKMLRGTAADALRPYAPKAVRQSRVEGLRLFHRLDFSARWNLRDVLRHKSRSAMTLVGVMGCMVLLVGGLGMVDTMDAFLDVLGNKVSNYKTKVNLADGADSEKAISLADALQGDWESSSGVNYLGETAVLQVYRASQGKIRFVDEKNRLLPLGDEGAYLCQRLKDTAQIGDTIAFSPYGSEETYQVKVAGYIRSVMTECIVMTEACAQNAGIAYPITAIYTDTPMESIAPADIISGMQDKETLMDTYDGFMELMDTMILVLVVAAVVLGVVVLYNLGVMSYVERSRELATLKVLGFRDRRIARLLISQNVWLTLLGVALALPAGIGVLHRLLAALAGEYELRLYLGPLTYSVSILLTFGVSLAVGWTVARKNRRIDMVEALKGAE